MPSFRAFRVGLAKERTCSVALLSGFPAIYSCEERGL